MERQIHGRPYKERNKKPFFTPCAPNSVLARLGDKWTILVMSHLARRWAPASLLGIEERDRRHHPANAYAHASKSSA